jgi:murein DD-endopeptidase MepM/ murein hydrolase activator NlpD
MRGAFSVLLGIGLAVPPAPLALQTVPLASQSQGTEQPQVTSNDYRALIARRLALPVPGVDPTTLQDTFNETRDGGRRHGAIDIPAPAGTKVVAVDDGTIRKLFFSVRGGITIYQFDPTGTYCYYYAHLQQYAPGLEDGQAVKRGDTIAYTGSSGDTSARDPHLHFEITKLGPEKHWWEGTAINPYPILTAGTDK